MLKNKFIKTLVFSILSLVFINSIQADNHAQNSSEHDGNHKKEATDEAYDPIPVIMHHIADAHDWHFFDYNGHAVSMPLPIILWTDNGLVTFMSSEFHHDNTGEHVVEKKGMRFIKFHEKIYQLKDGAPAGFDYETTIKPLDLSITKNVFAMLMSVLIILIVFIKTASHYAKNGAVAPKGIASFMEPLIIFVRDDIAKVNIGEKKYMKFMPYLLTVFFFIWFNNLLGLIPWIGGANLTGNIAVTFVLAVFTMLVTNFNGNKEYWGHIFWMPGAPVPVKIMLIPIELVGIVIKPFALMVRLFANITAGHIVVLSLISLIFIFKNAAMGAVSVPFALFISVLELLVAFLQAYVFTMLSALFIGTAVAEHEHH
ncbi:MAG: F0F1 ATP synthase subunit A [Flavobacteriales bacterium]|nr:F0F1 ATP synthase subunit A [Flavobacteriales bacterium]